MLYELLVYLEVLRENEMNIINIPIGNLIPLQKCEKFIGTHIFSLHHKEINTKKAFCMIFPGQSSPVNLKFDIMIDITV